MVRLRLQHRFQFNRHLISNSIARIRKSATAEVCSHLAGRRWERTGAATVPRLWRALAAGSFGIAGCAGAHPHVVCSFTSAYIVRKGLPTLDERTGQYVHDWLSVSLPVALLLVNTVLLLLSSITMEFARRQITRQAALAPVDRFPVFPSARNGISPG